MGFTANEVWGTTPPGVQIPPSPRLAPALGPGPFAFPGTPAPEPGLTRAEPAPGQIRADRRRSSALICTRAEWAAPCSAAAAPHGSKPGSRPVAGRLAPAGRSGWQDRP